MLNFTIQPMRQLNPPAVPSFHQWVFPDGTLWLQFYRTPSGYLLRFTDLADFEVSADGQHTCCWPAPETSDNTVQHLYLNQILPLTLGLQGKLVFHASAVEIGEVAVAFMGASGRGKSTLAANFATNGFRFLTDDGLALETHHNHYHVIPSHPSIRLWEDSEQALITANTTKAPPVQFTSKSRFLSGQKMVFCEQSRPLRHIYFLGEGKAAYFVCKRMTSAVALIELVKHSFMLDIEQNTLLANHFNELSQLTQKISCYQLDYPRCFATLAEIRQAIINHVTHEIE
jgi:hypothetical protein